MNREINIITEKVTLMDNIILDVCANTYFITVAITDDSESYISEFDVFTTEHYMLDIVEKALIRVKEHFAILANFDLIRTNISNTVIISFNVNFVNNIKKQHEEKSLVSLNEIFLKEVEKAVDKITNILVNDSRHLRILDAINKTI